ncbi:MAG: 8-oxo-dGTP diphosphatase MutT [Cocleimonas sp.]
MMTIHVAVAVIINKQDQILISKRSANQHQGNKWEFPGGKVEDSETAKQALHREIIEELGIDITSSEHLIDITHNYQNDRKVFLETFKVTAWLGKPEGREGQPIRWVKRDELRQYDFPKANDKIVDLLISS